MFIVYVVIYGQARGELLDFWNGGTHDRVFIWGLKFEVGEIIWGLKFLYSPKLIFSLTLSGGQLINRQLRKRWRTRGALTFM